MYMNPIPFYSLQAQHQLIEQEAKSIFSALYNDSRFILAERLKKFEEEFAGYTGGKYCIGVGNGLDALYISLKILGVGRGDEVIVPGHTYIATWLAVSRTGALPVPVEADANTWLIDVNKIEQAITSKTKAIVPVHLYGLVCDMNKLKAIADKAHLKIVEDNAQATGASFQNKKTGTWGQCNAFSFYPTKTLGALGDGGAIVTDSQEYCQRARSHRNYGSTKQFVNEIKGVNSRLDEMQAALLSAKLPHLDQWNEERKKIATLYTEQLREVEGIEMPVVINDTDPVYHLFPIKVEKNRDEVRAYLNSQGVETSVHYPTPPHLQKAYEEINFKKGSFPIAEVLASHTLSLPIWPGLMPDDVSRICVEIKKGLSSIK